MSLLQYFSAVPRGEVPNPEGPLSSIVPHVAIRAANAGVQLQDSRAAGAEGVKIGPYKMSEEKRAEIGKYVSEIGVVAASTHFSRELSKPLNESTVPFLPHAYSTKVVIFAGVHYHET